MAFRRKAEHILKFKPDILIVPECEHPDKLKFVNGTPIPTDIFWFGENTNKGIGIFSYSDYKFKLHKKHNPKFKIIVPLSVTNRQHQFNLFAIWANNPKDPDGTYITQIWKAIHYYDKLLTNQPAILIGDFNSNTIWDKPKREGNHSKVVEKLQAKNIHSVYHKFYKEAQGKETNPTLFLYRHQNKPYHLDYCFASAEIADKVTDVQVGSYHNWNAHSDHSPLIVTVDL